MNILDSIISYLSPETGYRRLAFRNALQEEEERAGYDAADHSRLNARWYANNEPAEWTDRAERDILRARARDLERNSDIMNSVVGAFKRNVYGAGYRLRVTTGDDETNTLIETAWQEWCRKQNCDVSGTQSFNGLMRTAIERKKVDGGILFIKCYTGDGMLPFKLQLVEVDELDDTAVSADNTENRVIGGIEYNKYNRPIGYHIRQYSLDGFSIEESKYYPAKDVIFYYSKKRPTQVREVTDMAPTLTRIRDINEFIRALAVKERILACLSVFIQRTAPPTLGRTYEGRDDREYQGKTVTPGMIQYLNPGETVQTVQPSGQATDAERHVKQQMHLLGSGQGLSYETASRDMSESNYSSARQGAIEDELTYEEERELLLEVMDEIFETFVISLWLTGRLKKGDFWEHKQTYFSHKWIRSPKRWIDPEKEAKANMVALQTGQKTWADMAAENGKDWREQVDEIIEILNYGDERGLDMRKVVFGEATERTETGRSEE